MDNDEDEVTRKAIRLPKKATRIKNKVSCLYLFLNAS